MLASEWNPVIQRGGTWSVSIGSEDANGNSTDFSGYNSMRMVVRPAWVGKPGTIKKDPLLTLSTTTGEIVVDTTTITLTLTAAQTAAITFNSGKFEFEMIIDATVDPVAAEVIDKLLYGTIHVTGEIIV